jgi:hypothetical protein
MARSKTLSEQALHLAQRLHSRETMAEALTARLHALSGPDDIDAQASVAAQMLELDGDSRSWITMEAHVTLDGRSSDHLHRSGRPVGCLRTPVELG